MYQQTVSGHATGNLVASLDASYWNDINRLVNASTLFSDNDTIYGFGGKDALLGGGDVDRLYGGKGVDYLYGGIGDDSLYGEEDGDVLFGNSGIDYMMGGSGNDEMYGGEGGDTLRGDADNDILWGGDDQNKVLYANDTDWLYGDAGNDILHGGSGAYDHLYGGDNDDELWGDDGSDSLYGGNGNDSLYGGRGTDYLFGEAGNDGLFGGIQDGYDDTMTGGTGADRFLRYETYYGLQYATIADLKAEDAEVRFTTGDKVWTDNEVVAVDKGLAFLHNSTGNTKLLKLPNGQTQYFSRMENLGADVAGDNARLGTIQIADLAIMDGIDRTAVHEIGHNWDSPALAPGFAALTGWKYHNLSNAPIPSGYTQANKYGLKQGVVGNDGKYYCWIYLTNAPFARDYGQTNPDEDFATCLEEYYAVKTGKASANPSGNWQAKYNYISTWLFNKITF